MARTFALLLAGIVFASVASASLAADVPYGISIDGRPLDALNRSGLNRDGILYVNVVRTVRTFSGLLTFGRGGEVRVSIGGRTMLFRLGSKTAILDGTVLQLSGAPFKRGGDIFVPLATVATFGRAKLTVDRSRHRASLTLGAGEGFPVPAPTSTEQSDVRPSPAQALSFATSATIEADGLHARVLIANTTAQPYTVDFPTAAQVAFVVSKNGVEIWNSQAVELPPEPSHLTFEARGSKTVAQTWPGFVHLGSGRYTLRVRLLTAVPLDTAPVSLGVATPGPTGSN